MEITAEIELEQIRRVISGPTAPVGSSLGKWKPAARKSKVATKASRKRTALSGPT
jgi:hypothetical protein